MRNVTLALASLLVVGLAACGGEADPQGSPEGAPPPAAEEPAVPAKPKAPWVRPDPLPVRDGWTRYENKERGYAVQYPKEWEISKPTFGTMPVLFLRPRKAEPKPGEPKEFRENFNVGVRQRSKAFGLEASYEAQVKGLMSDEPKPKIESTEEITVNGRTAKKVVLTIPKGDLPLRMHLYLLVSDSEKSLYVVTAGAPQDTFAQYEPVFEAAIQTLEVLAE